MSLPTNKRGFTLIELLVVIAIIGLLASVVIASLNSARQKGRDARRIADLKSLQLALELYYDTNSSYPVATSLAGLAPTYIPVIPSDPSSGSYAYQGLTSAGAACGAAPCPGYLLRATLELNNPTAFSSAYSGAGVGAVSSCAHASAPFYYCIRN